MHTSNPDIKKRGEDSSTFSEFDYNRLSEVSKKLGLKISPARYKKGIKKILVEWADTPTIRESKESEVK